MHAGYDSGTNTIKIDPGVKDTYQREDDDDDDDNKGRRKKRSTGRSGDDDDADTGFQNEYDIVRAMNGGTKSKMDRSKPDRLLAMELQMNRQRALQGLPPLPSATHRTRGLVPGVSPMPIYNPHGLYHSGTTNMNVIPFSRPFEPVVSHSPHSGVLTRPSGETMISSGQDTTGKAFYHPMLSHHGPWVNEKAPEFPIQDVIKDITGSSSSSRGSKTLAGGRRVGKFVQRQPRVFHLDEYDWIKGHTKLENPTNDMIWGQKRSGKSALLDMFWFTLRPPRINAYYGSPGGLKTALVRVPPCFIKSWGQDISGNATNILEKNTGFLHWRKIWDVQREMSEQAILNNISDRIDISIEASFDDVSKDRKFLGSEFFRELAVVGRWYEYGQKHLIHKITQVPPVARDNHDQSFIFMPGKRSQMRALYDELVDDVFTDGKEGWLEWIDCMRQYLPNRGCLVFDFNERSGDIQKTMKYIDGPKNNPQFRTTHNREIDCVVSPACREWCRVQCEKDRLEKARDKLDRERALAAETKFNSNGHDTAAGGIGSITFTGLSEGGSPNTVIKGAPTVIGGVAGTNGGGTGDIRFFNLEDSMTTLARFMHDPRSIVPTVSPTYIPPRSLHAHPHMGSPPPYMITPSPSPVGLMIFDPRMPRPFPPGGSLPVPLVPPPPPPSHLSMMSPSLPTGLPSTSLPSFPSYTILGTPTKVDLPRTAAKRAADEAEIIFPRHVNWDEISYKDYRDRTIDEHSDHYGRDADEPVFFTGRKYGSRYREPDYRRNDPIGFSSDNRVNS